MNRKPTSRLSNARATNIYFGDDHMTSKKYIALWIFFLAFLLGAPLFSQSDTYVNKYNATGVDSFRSYSGLQENINLYNDNLQIVIPLFTLKGRNGFDFPVLARYNSKLMEWVWHEDEYGGYYAWELIAGLGVDDEYFNVQLLPYWQYLGTGCSSGTSVPNLYVMTETDGTRHQLMNRDWGAEVVPCEVTWTNEIMESRDSSHMEFRESTSALYLKDGTYLLSDQLVRDTNGNKITSTYNPSTFTETVTDSLGRRVEKRSTVAYNYDIRIQDADGTQRTYRLTPTELIFPGPSGAANGLRYQFQWQDFGPISDPAGFVAYGIYEKELVRITHPTNGYTRYAWQQRTSQKGPTEIIGKYVNAADGKGEAYWQYTDSPTYTQVTRPDGTFTRHFFDPYGQETDTEYWTSGSTLIKKITRVWSWIVNPRLERETTILKPYQDNLRSKIEYSYDSNGYGGGTNGNITEIREYAFGSGAPGGLVRRTNRSYLYNSTYGLGPNGFHILDRKTQEVVYDGAGARKAQTHFYYDNYSSPRTLLSTSGAVQRDAAFGTSYTTRGNVTSVGRWLNTSGATLTTLFRYDICGNVRETTDPKGYTSKTHYNATYQFAYPYALEDAKGFIAYRDYNFNNTTKNGFGYLTRDVDINNATTTFTYDRLGRNKTISYSPDQGLVESFYSDFDLLATHRTSPVFQNQGSSLPLRKKVFTKIQDSPSYLEKVDLSVFDGFERPFMSSTSNNSQMDWTRTEYDGHGRVQRTSNPKSLANATEIPSADSFDKWTSYEYDVLDRVTGVTTQDGQSVTTEFGVNLAALTEMVTVTDQVGNLRRSEYNALGHLKVAREPNPGTGQFPGFDTTYTYDVLNNLTQVVQESQSRGFTYDSLSRLRAESQPESGNSTYDYDANSNLIWKTDSQGTTTNYNGYDQLNRPATVSYTDGTPTVSYTYDTSAYGKGRLATRTDGIGSETFQYDSRGRVSSLTRTSNTISLTGNYTYNRIGGVTAAAFPGIWDCGTPLTIYWDYDNAGRQKASRWSNNGCAYQELVDNFSFVYETSVWPDPPRWARERVYFDNGTVETVDFNDRLQPNSRVVTNPTTLLNLSYNFNKPDAPGTNGNNGNVWSINDTLDSSRSQTFTYDRLNRVQSFYSPSLTSQTYSIDRYGNRSCSVGCPALSFDPFTNHISTAGYGYSPPQLGNLTSDPYHTYQYDAEKRIKTVDSGSTATYSYDGAGRRVKKVTPTETRYYFYDPDGRPMWEYVPGIGYETFHLYLNDERVAMNDVSDGLLFLHRDHLGTPVLKTRSNGQEYSREMFPPYGEQIGTPPDTVNYDFTGQERDTESGLQYFGARYYSGVQGRFTSPDVPLLAQTPDDPQSWNLYAYVRNKPLGYSDPTGRKSVWKCGGRVIAGDDAKIDHRTGTLTTANGDVYNLSDVTYEPEEGEASNQQPTVPTKGTPLEPLVGSLAISGVLAADDLTGVGVADDVLIPIIILGGTVVSLDQYVQSSIDRLLVRGAVWTFIWMARRGGKENVRDTGLDDLDAEEVSRRARDRNLPGKERKRYQKEEKGRKQRNKQKRDSN